MEALPHFPNQWIMLLMWPCTHLFSSPFVFLSLCCLSIFNSLRTITACKLMAEFVQFINAFCGVLFILILPISPGVHLNPRYGCLSFVLNRLGQKTVPSLSELVFPTFLNEFRGALSYLLPLKMSPMSNHDKCLRYAHVLSLCWVLIVRFKLTVWIWYSFHSD